MDERDYESLSERERVRNKNRIMLEASPAYGLIYFGVGALVTAFIAGGIMIATQEEIEGPLDLFRSPIVENVLGGPEPEKFYVHKRSDGTRDTTYVEIDRRPAEDYVSE